MNFAAELDALIAGTLDPAGFRHETHIAVAFEALERFDFFKAYAVLSDGLNQAARRAGVPHRFSATVTFAFLSEIAERRAQAAYADAASFVAENPDLASRTFLTSRYSPARLDSQLARTVPLLPDLPSHPGVARV